MQTTEYRMLQVLAEEMNMRKAAEKLFVSQPALSQRLQTIEKNWGTKIFLRSQKGLTLTAAGEKIVEHAISILEQEEKIREQVSALDTEVHGTLKLAVASIIGQYWLPHVLKKFVERYPLVKISLMTGWSSEILDSLYEDQVHIGISRGATDWRGKKLHLLSDSLYLVDREIQSIEELRDTSKPFIQFKSDSTYFQEIQEWWYSQFQTSPKRTIVVDQIETCKQMALNGIGFAILPSIALTSNDAHVYKIPLKNEKTDYIKRDTWLIGYESSFDLKQVRAFLELVDEYKQTKF